MLQTHPVPKAPPPSARLALRAATAEVHQRLHHSPVFAVLAETALTRSRYRSVLERLWGIHAPLEASLLTRKRELEACGFSLRNRRRVHLLRADLRSLGLSDPEIDVLPRITDFTLPARLPALLGCLYVREGATLGGAVLAARVRTLLSDDAPVAFFSLTGSDRAALWRECVELIERLAVAPGALAEMIEGARMTFAAFEEWLGSHG